MKFGQYELLELIAVGGMAEVFRGRVVGAEGFEKYVAIKRILPDLAEDERFVTMLLTEARIHSALSHRNIVQIHDLGISEDGQYFIVLEFVEGYDLRMIVEQLTALGEIVPEALSLHIASELAQALHFAHEARGADGQRLGLVHRDVTPSNVLISFAGEVKLSDFGLAKRRHDRSVVGSLKGNLSYMSPEQAMQTSLDRRTDIFSLGAVLFEMLTGRRLREITNEVAAWSHVASGAVPSARQVRPDLPVAIERLLDRALAADPAQRYPDAAAFGSAIRDVLTGMNVAVGASDLGALLGAVNPPRRPRHLMVERSRVIRLGPEAQALREAFAAPATPAPLAFVAAAAVAAQPSRNPVGRLARPSAAVAAAVQAAVSPAVDPDATPPPSAPLPPLRPRTATPPPLRPRTATPAPPRPRTATPAPPRPRTATPYRTAPGAGGRPAAGPARSAATPRGPMPAVATGPRRVTGERPAVPQPFGLGPVATPARGTTARQPALAGRAAAGRRPTGQFRPPVQMVPQRVQRETARVQIRSRGSWRGMFMLLVLVLLGGVAAVHRFVVPLDVLVTWREPAALAIATDPEGASLRLDGVSLPSSAPTTVRVHRDLGEHLIEAALPGYLPARATVRYDKSVGLSALLRLKNDPSVVPPAPAVPPPPAAAGAPPQ